MKTKMRFMHNVLVFGEGPQEEMTKIKTRKER